MHQNMLKEYGKFYNLKPDDFVIATKENYKIKDFIIECCKIVGLNWKKFLL